MRFYQGTNLLGSIETANGLFTTENTNSYRADKEKMALLVDEPIRKAVEEKQSQKKQ